MVPKDKQCICNLYSSINIHYNTFIYECSEIVQGIRYSTYRYTIVLPYKAIY